MKKSLLVVWESSKKNKCRSIGIYKSSENAESMAKVIRRTQKRKVDVIDLTPENLNRIKHS